MGLVDSWNLKWEVKAEYPYSTYICDTEEQAMEKIAFEKAVHHVQCQVRVVGDKVKFYGVPPRYQDRIELPHYLDEDGWADGVWAK